MMSVACSNQWRDAAGIDSTRMLAALGEISGAQAASGSGDLQSALALKDQEGVRIYYAESTGITSPMGPVASIVSLTDFGFLGFPGMIWSSFEEARVFFMDVPGADGSHTNSLIVGLRKPGESALTYAGYTGSASIGDIDMVVTLQANGADKVVLRTFDVDGGDLENVIQMLVWDIDPSSGAELYNGKFSTLIGFGD
jgi:hypothetical protein